jgi:hypothetical protein
MIAALAGAFLLGVTALPLDGGSARADTNPLDALLKAALDVCKGLSNPGQKDECVSNAHNRYGKGKGAAKKPASPGKSAGKKGGKGKGKN